MKSLRRLILTLLLGLFAGGVFLSAASKADTMLWPVKSLYAYKVQVEFYSESRKWEWPGGASFVIFYRAHIVSGALAPADDADQVAPPNVDRLHHSTSGANEMILVNCRSRSSRATGPKIRVPTGFSSGLMRTTALRSKRM